MFAYSGGRGGYLKTDENRIVSYEGGRREVVFAPPPPEQTEFLLTELLDRYNTLKAEGQTHPLVLIGGLILDFLAIHPVADGNGRLDRLYRSQRGWHEGEHDIWPWTTYLAQVVAGAYEDFERRVAAADEPEGSKQGRARAYILEQAPVVFRRREIERALPEVSPATIRLVLNALRDSGEIVAEGAGPSARWRRGTGDAAP